MSERRRPEGQAPAAHRRPARRLSWLLAGALLLSPVAGWLAPAQAQAQEAERPGAEALEAGLGFLERGELTQALVKLSLALRAFRGAEDEPGQIQATTALGAVHRRLRRWDDAREQLAEAQRIAQRVGDDAGLARAKLNQGLLELDMGDARRAEGLFEEAFRGARDAGQPGLAADAASNLGLARAERGDLAAAERAFGAALELFGALEDVGGQVDARINRGQLFRRQSRFAEAIEDLTAAREAARGSALVSASNNLALVYQDVGRRQEAVSLLIENADRLRSGSDRGAYAATLANLATLLQQGGQPEEAQRRYGEALEQQRALGNERAAAGLLLNLGTLAREQGRLAAASQQLEEAEAAYRGLRDRRGQGACWLQLGQIALAQGEPAEGGRTLDRALNAIGELDPELRWRALHARAEAHQAADEVAEALPLLREAVDLIEDSRRGLAADPGAQRAFLVGRADVYRDLIDALLATGDSQGAFLYNERLQVTELAADSAGGAADETEAEFAAFAAREAALERRLAQQLGLPEEERDEVQLEALRERLAELRVEFSQFVDGLRENYEGFDRLVKIDPEDLETIQRDLPPGVAVLQPILLPDRVATLVFTRDGLFFGSAEAESRTVERTIARITGILRNRRLDDVTDVTRRAERLYEWIIKPIEGQLEGIDELVICAAGAFRYIPFQLLYSGEDWLVERFVVSNITNVGALHARGQFALRSGVFGMANPDGSLPAAETEVRGIATLFPAGRYLYGAEATLAGLEDQASGKTVVHLATHGVLADDPAESYILMAHAQDGNNKLGYRAIPGLSHVLGETDLVVLSACETAVATGDEERLGRGAEISGIANQFRRAGVPSLIASLWQVSDESTSLLMARFYSELAAGTRPVEALRAAQLELLADDARSHPFHWAPFILIGAAR